MDLEFLGRPDLGEYFLQRYRRLSADDSPASLHDFYIAYRAVVRAKVDCISHTQEMPMPPHVRNVVEDRASASEGGAVRLILVGGGQEPARRHWPGRLPANRGSRHLHRRRACRDGRKGEIARGGRCIRQGLYTGESRCRLRRRAAQRI